MSKKLDQILLGTPVNNNFSNRDKKILEKQLKKIKKSYSPDKFVIELVSKKRDERKVKNLLIYAYYYDYQENGCYFVGDEAFKYEDKEGRNFIQIAIETGYSTKFITDMLHFFGHQKSYILDCNSIDKNGKNIMHTAAENYCKQNLDIAEIYHILNTRTCFDKNNFRALDNYNESVIDIASKQGPQTTKDIIHYKVFYAIFNNNNFDIIMKKLSDNADNNYNLISESLTNYYILEELKNRYNLKSEDEILLLCFNEKYSDEKFLLDCIEKILKTKICDVNIKEREFAKEYDLIEKAIKMDYSENFIKQLIELFIQYDFDKKRFVKILHTAIFHSSEIINVYEFYEFLRKKGFNLVNEGIFLNANDLRKLSLYNLYNNKEGVQELINERNTANFIKSINESLSFFELELESLNIVEYRELFSCFSDLYDIIDIKWMVWSFDKNTLSYIIVNKIIENRSNSINDPKSKIKTKEIYSAIKDVSNNIAINELTEEDISDKTREYNCKNMIKHLHYIGG